MFAQDQNHLNMVIVYYCYKGDTDDVSVDWKTDQLLHYDRNAGSLVEGQLMSYVRGGQSLVANHLMRDVSDPG